MKKPICLHFTVAFLALIGICTPINGSWLWRQKQKINSQLLRDTSYEIFDCIPEEEIKILAGMKIKLGKIESLHFVNKYFPSSSIGDFLQDIENADTIKNKVMPIILTTYYKILKKQKAIISGATMELFGNIVVENETTIGDVGWHVDNPEQACHIATNEDTDKKSYRILVSIIGEGTVFTSHKCDDEFLKIYCNDPFVQNSRIVKCIDGMISQDSRQQLRPGQAVIFDKNLAIHMRPVTNQPRMFMMLDCEVQSSIWGFN